MNLKESLAGSHFVMQLKQAAKANKTKPLNPLHLLVNMAGLTVFPFVARPMLQHIGDLSPETFNAMMLERKKLIPVWMNAIIKSK